jgi:hypothetical protein
VTQQPSGILGGGGGGGGDDDDDKEGRELLVIALRHYNHHETHGTLLSHSWRPCFLLGMSQVWQSDS